MIIYHVFTRWPFVVFPNADRRHFFVLKLQTCFCRDCVDISVSNLIGCLISLKIIKCLLTWNSEQYNNSNQWSNMICSSVKIKKPDFFFFSEKEIQNKLFYSALIKQRIPCNIITLLLIKSSEDGSALNNITISVPTSKRTHGITIRNISLPTMFGKTIYLHSGNQTKPIHKFCWCNAELLNVKADDIHTYVTF